MFQIMIAAACGWFLLSPPTQEELKDGKWRTGNWSVAAEQPYAKWEHQSAHDMAKDCEMERARIFNDAMKRTAEITEKWDVLEEQYREIFRSGAKFTPEQFEARTFLNPRALAARQLSAMKARCIPSDVLLSPVKK